MVKYLLIIAAALPALLMPARLRAQTLWVNGGSLYISDGSVVTVNGSSNLVSGSSVYNYGTIRTSGNWTHAIGTLLGTGTIELNSDGAQYLRGSDFYNLTASRGDQKLVWNPLRISGNLRISECTMTMVSGDSIFLSENSRYYRGNGGNIDVGHIVATRTLYQGVEEDFGGIGLSIKPLNGSPGLTKVVCQTGRNSAIDVFFAYAGLAYAMRARWDVYPTVNADLNATVTIKYSDLQKHTWDESKFNFWRSLDGGSTYSFLGYTGRNLDSNMYYRNGLSKVGGRYTLSALPGTTLPLTWLSFTGMAKASGNELRWQTASESNTDRFEIERSENGSLFFAVGRLAAAGYSDTVLSYAFTDPVSAGTWCYRLRQLDRDGKSSYSSVVRIARGGDAGMTLTAFPNPFRSTLHLHFCRPLPEAARFRIRLLDASARTVREMEVLAAAGASQAPLAGLGDLPGGSYFVDIASEAGHWLLPVQHSGL